MNIISGSKKGKHIKLCDDNFRPTQAKVREAFFNIFDVVYSDFLDLCAGSGAMGFEALSRGAKHSTFVEIDRLRVKALFENSKSLFSNDSLCTIKRYSALDYTKRTNDKYDIIYFDPPYNSLIYQNTIENIIERKLLNENGSLIIELDSKTYKKNMFFSSDFFEEKWYGNTCLLIYK